MNPAPRNKFSRYPLFWLSICFICGIVPRQAVVVNVWVLMGIAVGCGIGALVLTRRQVASVTWAGVPLFLAFFVAGAFCLGAEQERNASGRLRNLYDEGAIASSDPVEIDGTLTSAAERSLDGVWLELRVLKITFKGTETAVRGNVRLFLSLNGDAAEQNLNDLDLSYGSKIRVECRLERENKYQNPGVVSNIQLLDTRDIDATGVLKSVLLIEKTGDGFGISPLGFVYKQRQYIIGEFHRRFSTATAGVMIASLLGDKYYLDKNTADIFREGGTFHVLVISGLHITFIGGLLLLFVRLFTRAGFGSLLLLRHCCGFIRSPSGPRCQSFVQV